MTFGLVLDLLGELGDRVFLNWFIIFMMFVIHQDLYIMLYSARSRKPGTTKTNDSGSKNSKDSNIGRSKNKMHSISQTQLKLRQAINLKYEKSKIKNYQYLIVNTNNIGSKSKNKISQSSSQNSIKMSEYAFLVGQRFINLKDYLNKNGYQSDKKNIVKMRISDNKKTIKTQQDTQWNTKNYYCIMNDTQKKNPSIKQTIYAKKKPNTTNTTKPYDLKNQNNRTVYSGQKNQRQWKIQYHSATKYNQFYKRISSAQQEQQPKSKLHLMRKLKKSPAQNKYI